MKPAEVSTPSDQEVLIKRSFDAPVDLVWQAYTDPALMRRWLTAMPGWSMPVCEMATHVGGKYRWRWRDDEKGIEFGFTGEMLEVAPYSKIVHTQLYDPGDSDFGSMGGEPSIITVTFSETDGLTNVATLIKFASKEDRDAAISTGMTDGMEMSYKQLDGVLAAITNEKDQNKEMEFVVNKETKTVSITREFDAPRDMVWDAYTKPELLDQWWAPKPFASKTKHMDFQVGGRRFYAMVSPEGQERWVLQEYRSIMPKTNFKLFNAFADENENPQLPGSDWDFNFSERDGRTTVHLTIYNESLDRMERMIEMGAVQGIEAQLQNLEELLAKLSRGRAV